MTDDRTCPVCGEEIASVTLTGPDTAVISPCGHEVSPEQLEDNE